MKLRDCGVEPDGYSLPEWHAGLALGRPYAESVRVTVGRVGAGIDLVTVEDAVADGAAERV